ncbi:hypothetical protein [Erythrobacter sanguineus]|uniref:Homeodomain-like domain-containing protein n=1 Tax=Erythrobacter sanguineus TaxID=198312 RepID=A0A1M7SQK6_9SPHN|nr:hypothetical protein [Erythrobacter sanguineus]SHN60648.1 hypothetical protein SAMN02745193_02165 [Erythrobacter sanguineus]
MSHDTTQTALTTPAATTATAAPVAQTSVVDPANLSADLTPATQVAFVQTLAQWGNVRAAAQQVGVSRAHLYRMRRASPQFRKLWDAALVLARPQVEEVLADRALNGVQETVFYHGEEVATRTRYDSRLLLAHLGRLDRMGATHAVHIAARDFDERLAHLLDPPAIIDWDDDDDDDEDGDEGCDDAYGEGGYADEGGADEDGADEYGAGDDRDDPAG